MRSAIVSTAMLVLVFGGTAQGASYRILHDFCAEMDCADGAYPFGSMALDTQGNLYGTASGGTGHSGIVFELQRGRGKKFKIQTLYNFCKEDGCLDGQLPHGVIRDVSGNLYGMTYYGGTSNDGVAYRLAPRRKGDWKQTLLQTFAGPNGSTPDDAFGYVGATSGQPYDGTSPLYGTTVDGGTDPQGGTVFTLTPNGAHWTFETIYNFISGSGNAGSPFTTPVLDASGNLFGTTADGSGAVYELTHGGGGWSEKVLYAFCDTCNDNTIWPGELTFDTAGALVGATASSGPYCGFDGQPVRCGGGVFRLAPDGAAWDYSALYYFCAKNKQCRDGEDGEISNAKVGDASGNTYGTASSGGKYHGGVLYRIRTDGTYEVVHDFCSTSSCTDGGEPEQLIVAADGKTLYGIAAYGGAYGKGLIFEYAP